MPTFRPRIESSVLIVIDEQPGVMKAIHESERVHRRSLFLARLATLLHVPILASEQVPDKLGHTDPTLWGLLSFPAIAKTTFGCCESADFIKAFRDCKRSEAILIGIESHICVSQTALGLLDLNVRVAVCPDAISARTMEMHKIGMERMRDAGVAPIHSEAVAYEWIGTSEHSRFREAVQLVKEFSAS